MGYVRHDAIVCTSFDENYIEPARAKAELLGLPVTDIVKSPVNAYYSFLIAPDGSKEGWDESDRGDEARAAWKDWANEQWTTNGLYVYWAHLSYAGDEPTDTKLVEQAARVDE